MTIKIATLNLCLGLQFNKDLIKEFILSESIDIMCCQETEIKNNIAKENLTFPGFELIATLGNIPMIKMIIHITPKHMLDNKILLKL